MAPEKFIEVSFEVSNKVGGIYQVLKSKTSKMQDYYGENYLTIGYYDKNNAATDFAPRGENPYEYIFAELEKELGIKCRYGAWNIPGEPKTILIDPSGLKKPVDEIKKEMWEEYGIDSLNTGPDFDEPIKWSYCVGKLLQKIAKNTDQETVVQLHEWLSGPAQFYNDLPTIFTTHATVLGRALSNSDHDLNQIVENKTIEDQKAEELGVKPKHQVEKTSAEQADVFTTVSENTGKEAEKILGTKPDKILPNGFNVEQFPSLEELSYQHKKKKKQMKQFLRAYFKPYYDVDLENDPRILFISGRYEFRNKGIDLFIDALSEVNEKEGEEFFVFIFVPTDVKREKPEIMENLSLYDELEDYIDNKITDIKEKMLNTITSAKPLTPELEKTLEKDKQELENLENNFHAKKGQKPPLSAYELNYAEDEILERLYEKDLHNNKGDRVKVVYYPTYLSVGDKMLSMNYKDAVVASTAGIFPSYYEPWGYTPVETAANGALSITTDLAGFGQFLQEKTSKDERKGIEVLERKNKNDEDAKHELAQKIENIIDYSKTEITERKHNARRLAQMTSWEKLGKNYKEAHEKALKNKKEES